MKRTIVIGDVHGCLDEFQQLLAKLAYAPGKDRLILLGDLMDRGPEPAACVRFARESRAEIVQSNHDDKHIRYRRHFARKASDPAYNGSAPKLRPKDVEENAKLTDDDIEWLANAPNIIRIPSIDVGGKYDVIAVHAGFENLGVAPEDAPRGVCIRCRSVDAEGHMVAHTRDESGKLVEPPGSVPWASVYTGQHHVIYGHAVHSLDKPRVDWEGILFRIGIDTGACYGGHLTARVFNGGPDTIVQVKATRAWDEWHGP